MEAVILFVGWLFAGILTLCCPKVHRISYACLWLAHLLVYLPDAIRYMIG